MAKKRLSLDLDLDDYNDKKIWDYLETKKVKSKAIKSIISAYLDGVEIPKVNIETKDKECLNDTELLNKDDIDASGLAGF